MHSEAVKIRMAGKDDAEAIVGLARQLAAAVDDPPPALDAAKFIRNACGNDRWCDCLLAEQASLPIAYALACRGFEAHTGLRRLWLADLYVSPGARQKGVARALMRAIAQHALDLDCAAVYWDLWRKNAVGAAFYRDLAAEKIEDLEQFRLDAGRLAVLAREHAG